ncbi:hypothetical protein FNH05_18180 [Amycolatopsis rhizosphaerae]|uniref:Uncharacterized protein n=1 Tax=Amycolatopsis rhizosphaerae TaxID=2053003 RepID=A0A558CH51_9PSEU|nr:YaaC family protein [Amycolatopsis rhizosphaerae]TVT48099.1 hypothetical protein FNH05_18180 [Amycolatopsis rhizosphaerae]
MIDSETWSKIRQLRSNPPGQAKSDKNRRRTFLTSLEQAEQYFRAANSMGYETRPVTLFYGLSQFGRSIAAAAPDTDWKLKGHGIRIPNIGEASSSGKIANLLVRNNGSGSFTQLAKILNSPSLEKPVILTRILSSIPEMREYPIDKTHIPPLDLSEGYDKVGPSGDFGPAWKIILEGVPSLDASMSDFLAHYPAIWPLQGRPLSYEQGVCRGHGPGVFYLTPRRKYEMGGFAAIHGTEYRGRNLVFPTLPGYALNMHPILTWWASLFSLSMLARYEPVAWADIVNVDQSMESVPIERLLSVATEAVPEIALAAIGEVAQDPEEKAHTQMELIKSNTRNEYRTFGEIFKESIAPRVRSTFNKIASNTPRRREDSTDS